jgi:hypothetical protein
MSVRFLAWSLEEVPLAGAILVALAAGFLLAAVPLSIGRWRARARVRALESKVETLETALAAREVPHLTPRPVSPPNIRSA